MLVEDDTHVDELFQRYSNPKSNQEERQWSYQAIDLSSYGGKEITIIFKVKAGPYDDNRNDPLAFTAYYVLFYHRCFYLIKIFAARNMRIRMNKLIRSTAMGSQETGIVFIAVKAMNHAYLIQPVFLIGPVIKF